MRQRSAKSVQLPDHQAIASADEGKKRLTKAGAFNAAAARRGVLEQVPFVDPGCEQCVALQVQHLAVALGRDAPTSMCGKPRTQRFRTVLHSDRVFVQIFRLQTARISTVGRPLGKQVIPDTRGDPGLQLRSELNRLISLSEHITPFQLCPLMRTRGAFR